MMRSLLLAVFLAAPASAAPFERAAGPWSAPLSVQFGSPLVNGAPLHPDFYARFETLDLFTDFGRRAAGPLVAALEAGGYSPASFTKLSQSERNAVLAQAFEAASTSARAEAAEAIRRPSAARLEPLAHYGVYYLDRKTQHEVALAYGAAREKAVDAALEETADRLTRAAKEDEDVDPRWRAALRAGLPVDAAGGTGETARALADLDLARGYTTRAVSPLARFLEDRGLDPARFPALPRERKRALLSQAIEAERSRAAAKVERLLNHRDAPVLRLEHEERHAAFAENLLVYGHMYLHEPARDLIRDVLPEFFARRDRAAEPAKKPAATPRPLVDSAMADAWGEARKLAGLLTPEFEERVKRAGEGGSWGLIAWRSAVEILDSNWLAGEAGPARAKAALETIRPGVELYWKLLEKEKTAKPSRSLGARWTGASRQAALEALVTVLTDLTGLHDADAARISAAGLQAGSISTSLALEANLRRRGFLDRAKIISRTVLLVGSALALWLLPGAFWKGLGVVAVVVGTRIYQRISAAKGPEKS